MMSARLDELRATLAGLHETGVPLVAIYGETLTPAGQTDDVGIYLFIPWLAHRLGLDIPQAAALFFGVLAVLSLALSFLGAVLWCKTRYGRLLGMLVPALIIYRTHELGDVYMLAAFTPCALLLLSLWARELRGPLARCAALQLGFGVLIGFSQLIRGHSGTAILLFIVIGLACDGLRRPAHRVALVATLLAGVLLPQLPVGRVAQHREDYLREQGAVFHTDNRHPFWHNVYIGFAFLQNAEVPAYSDTVSADRVQELSPGAPYLSPQYERVLRDEVLRLCRRQPRFVLRTLAAKLGVLTFYFVLMANIGLLASLVARKPFWLWLGFLAAIAFSSLFGLLVMPVPVYLTGFLAVTGLFGVVSSELALRHDRGTPWKVVWTASMVFLTVLALDLLFLNRVTLGIYGLQLATVLALMELTPRVPPRTLLPLIARLEAHATAAPGRTWLTLTPSRALLAPCFGLAAAVVVVAPRTRWSPRSLAEFCNPDVTLTLLGELTLVFLLGWFSREAAGHVAAYLRRRSAPSSVEA